MTIYQFEYDLNNSYINVNHLQIILNTTINHTTIQFKNVTRHHISFKKQINSNTTIEQQNELIINELQKSNYTVRHFKIIYIGIRDHTFTDFIFNLLKLSKIKMTLLYKLFNIPEAMLLYEQIFTHKSASDKNYEFYEFYGDVTLNKSIVMFISKKFKHLNVPNGVGTLTRLKHNLISKRYFAKFAEQLDFWKYITISLHKKKTNMRKTLEDVFESFFGATEYLLNTYVKKGIGFYFCNRIVTHILQSQPISIKYHHIVDPATRLKELMDSYDNLTKRNEIFLKKINDHKKTFSELTKIEYEYNQFKKYASFVQKYFSSGLGKMEYKYEKIGTEDEQFFKFNAKVYLSGRLVGEGTASIKQDAKQNASENTLYNLRQINIIKPIPTKFR